MLILSLLVGSLLVGRQIVDRAKIQRIIFEFDYYEKAFHQFYDTYRYVPGALPYKECIKHAEFSGCACTNKTNCHVTQGACDLQEDVATWCLHHVNSRTISAKIVNNTQRSKHNSMIQAKKAGLISQEAYPFNGGNWLGDGQQKASLMTTVSSTDGHAAVSSWNPTGRLNFRGWLPREDVEVPYQFYKDKLVNHNYLITYVTAKNSSDRVARQDKRASFVSAKMASELDAKIDDGRPGTGRVLGIKAGLSVPPMADKPHQGTTDEQKQVCFDQLDTSVEDINKAIYHSSTDLKYGCNIIKVMEDVK